MKMAALTFKGGGGGKGEGVCDGTNSLAWIFRDCGTLLSSSDDSTLDPLDSSSS